MAARRLGASRAAADMLIRAGVPANAVSLAGMAAALLAGACFALAPGSDRRSLLWLAGGTLTQVRLLANMLDGMVAIGRGTASPTGELYNEVPDRVSDSAILLGVGIAAGTAALGLAAALAAMATAYVRVLGRGLGAPGLFCGPMAKPHRMHLIAMLAVGECLITPSWRTQAAEATLWAITTLALVTAGRRLARIAVVLQTARP